MESFPGGQQVQQIAVEAAQNAVSVGIEGVELAAGRLDAELPPRLPVGVSFVKKTISCAKYCIVFNVSILFESNC